MKSTTVLTVLMAAGLAFSTPLIANAKKNGGHESQKGGLPALEDRVDANAALIAELQGRDNFAVVAADGTVVRASSPGSANSPAPVIVDHTVGTGIYEVDFGKDVTACAYTATIGDTASAVPTQGQVSVSGDVDGDSVNDVYVQTFDATGAVATDLPYHLYVSCP
jgi:hypothetical protein